MIMVGAGRERDFVVAFLLVDHRPMAYEPIGYAVASWTEGDFYS